MAEEQIGDEVASALEGWSEPRPQRIPAPTYQPAAMAMGITFMLFGFVTSYAFTAAGGLLFVYSLARWIGELVHGD
jgi:hypothetical protein